MRCTCPLQVTADHPAELAAHQLTVLQQRDVELQQQRRLLEEVLDELHDHKVGGWHEVSSSSS